MKCPNCKNTMSNVIHFEKGKNYAFHECKHCYTQTHQKRIHFEELEKGDSNDSNCKKKN